MSEVLFFRVHFHFFAHCHHNVLGSRYEVELQFKRRREMSEVVRKLRYNLNAQQPCRCSAPFMKKLGHLNQSWWGNMGDTGNMGGHRPKPKPHLTASSFCHCVNMSQCHNPWQLIHQRPDKDVFQLDLIHCQKTFICPQAEHIMSCLSWRRKMFPSLNFLGCKRKSLISGEELSWFYVGQLVPPCHSLSLVRP